VTHAIVLLSGGLDSTTVATHAVGRGLAVRGLCIRYGQLHGREVESARAVAAALGIPVEVVDASFYGRLAQSSLTAATSAEIPLGRTSEAIGEGIPSTYVPLRNTFFVTVAAAALESWMLDLIERQGTDPAGLEPAIFVGANAIDYSGYPDCRPEFYEAVSEVLRLGSKLGTAYGVPIRIEAPIIGMSKADIVRYGSDIGAPLHLTWSCYLGGEHPCGACDSCQLRAEGFAAAGIADPALGALP
jgi:7-cyano-7-deazaguanine synthase